MRIRNLAPVIAVLWLASAAVANAQESSSSDTQKAADDDATKVWSDHADLGLVVNAGSTSTYSFSFDNVLRGRWKRSLFTFKFGAFGLRRTDTLLSAVGTEEDFEVLEEVTELREGQRAYVHADYRRDIAKRFYWIAGANWDRDLDFGILSSITVFGGVGNRWIDRDDMKFGTNYSLALANRDMASSDPAFDGAFPGIRLAWDYLNRIGGNTTLTNDFQFYKSFKTAEAFRFDTMTAVNVAITKLRSLRTSLQFRYENLPAFLDVPLYDGDPSDPDSDVTGSVAVRDSKLSTTFKVTLVVNL